MGPHSMRPNPGMNQGPIPIGAQAMRSPGMPLSPGSMNSQMQNMRSPMGPQQMPMLQNRQMQVSPGMTPMAQPPVGMPQPVAMPPQGLPPQAPPNQPPQPAPPGSQPVPQKQGRVTSVPKPAGIDPVVILQERENRYGDNSSPV